MQDNTRQTSKWQLKGATYLENEVFHFVGDNINQETCLVFDVNGVQKTVAIPQPLKSLKEYYDEIKNGVVHYNIKKFEVNQYTVLTYDPSWLQTPDTAVCYCHLPYDARSNTPILCDKHDVINDMITRTQGCGVKVINKVLAIRLPVQDLGITIEDTQDEFLKKFNIYLTNNPFNVLYCLEQTNSFLLKDYAFDIQNSDNDITCQTQYEPSYFFVDYPVDVIINTTVNVKEVQKIAEEIKATKALIDEIKEDLDQKTSETTEQYHKIIEIQKVIEEQNKEINRLYKIIIESENNVAESIQELNKMQETLLALAEEIKTISENIKNELNKHNQDETSHSDIRLIITQIQQDLSTHNQDANSHNDMRQLIQNNANALKAHAVDPETHSDIREQIKDVSNNITFDFGSY